MKLLRYPAFLAACLSHLSVDTLNGQMGVLLAALSVSLALSNAQIGLIATVYSMLGSLSQPLFGWLADKDSGRWTTGLGVLWMAVFYALFALAPGKWAIGFLIAAALGSGLFHPPGTAKAAQVGALGLAGQAATAASIFFLFGQVGLSAGPAIGGVIMEHGGRAGVLWLALLVLPIALFTLWALRGARAVVRPIGTVPHANGAPLWLFLLVLVLSGVRTWSQTALTTFAPKFYQDQGVASSEYGVIVALFMAGTAVGGVMGSALADRWSYHRTVTVSLALSVVPFYLFPLATGAWIYLLAAMAGLFNGAPHSILVTMAQRALPGRAGLASGIVLGGTFSVASLGTYLSGWLADQIGLQPVLQMNALLALVTALLSLALFLESRVTKMATLSLGD